MRGAVLLAALCAAGCATSVAEPAANETAPAVSTPSPPPTSLARGETEPAPVASVSPLAARITSAGMLPAVPAVDEPVAPTSLRIESLGVRGAPVVAVGVLANGELEVPGAQQVGWYRFGSSPGAEGSAVLAAHIAYDGVDGVFRDLARLAAGAVVEVGFADREPARFRVESVVRIGKAELPPELFARAGPARLVLISCGGTFNRALRSYDDNIVAVAVPLG